MPKIGEVPEGAGIRALRFGRGFTGASSGLSGPLDFPYAHRVPEALGLGTADAFRLQRLVTTWDAVHNDDAEQLARLVHIDPHGHATVWTGELAYPCFIGTPLADLPAARKTLAEGAVRYFVLEALRTSCSLLFSDEGGFVLVPDNPLGLAYAAFALELSAGARGPVCVECGTPLDAQRRTKTYCGDRCKARARRRRELQREREQLTPAERIEALNQNALEPVPEYRHPEDLDDA